MSRKRSESNPNGNSRGKFINPVDFKVGDILMSNNWGQFEIIDYPEARYITIRFLKTGNTFVRQKGEILRGAVTDRDVINEKVIKHKTKEALKKDSFDVFMSNWNPTTHNKSVFKLPYFMYCGDRGWLYKGFTYVDEYTYSFASKIKWVKTTYVLAHLSADNCKRLGIQQPKGNTKSIKLHCWVKAMPTGVKDLLTDHKNGSTLDNRHNNLRIADFSQNSANSKPASKVGFKGVKVLKGSTKGKVIKNVVAQGWIPNGNKHKFLGKFYTIEEAARAVDIWNIQNYGEFARLNLKRTIYEEMGLLEPKPKKYKLP